MVASDPRNAAAQGFTVAGFVKEDPNNPLHQPVRGISFKDYAAMSVKAGSGISGADICKAMDVSIEDYKEASNTWIQRLQNDSSGQLSTLYGQYFSEAASHPKLQSLKSNISEQGQENLDKIKTDRYFFEELSGARAAATAHGLSGNEWLLKKFGIPESEFQAVMMQWMMGQNQNFNMDEISKYASYQQQQQNEYAAKFATGGI